jgi:hypothetical protein
MVTRPGSSAGRSGATASRPVGLVAAALLASCSLTDLGDLDSGAAAAASSSASGAASTSSATTSSATASSVSASTTAGPTSGGTGGAGGTGDGGAGGSPGAGGEGGGAVPCVDDGDHYAFELDAVCYRRSRQPATWQEARTQCAALGRGNHLATITDAEQLGIGGVLFPAGCEHTMEGGDPCDARVFIGGFFEGETLGVDPWTWVTGEEWTWPNGGVDPWADPDEPNSDFLALWDDGEIDGRPDGVTLPYLCEEPPPRR